MSPVLRAVIVDDERPARRELLAMLGCHACIEVVGEAGDAQSATDIINRMEPDVVFLDIEMPGESGFDLLNQIDIGCEVVFTTAFHEYAVRAFEVNAVDYLLKPIDPDRLRDAIERLSGYVDHSPSRSDRYRYSDTLLTRSGGRIRSIRISEIVFLEACGDYTEAVTSGGDRILVHRTMKEWEKRLPERRFCRIHRSTIVNLEHVEGFEERLVHMKTGSSPLHMSRRYAAKLRRELT